MANPKFLPVAKKIPYNIRMPKPLLDKLNAYAELTGNTTTDVVINALNEFIKDKIVFNDYLNNINSVTIKIPILYDEKQRFMNNVNLLNYSGVYSTNNESGDAIEITARTDLYEILKIPNNLDKFDEQIGFNSDGNADAHSGIEFIVIPETYFYLENKDILDALYCFYFVVNNDKLVNITLIDYVTAINKLNESNNIRWKNNLILCVNDLMDLKAEIEPDNNERPEMEKLVKIAKKYNTGYIIPLGDNIIESIADVEFKENSEYQIILKRILTLLDDLSDDEIIELFADKKENEKEPDADITE